MSGTVIPPGTHGSTAEDMDSEAGKRGIIPLCACHSTKWPSEASYRRLGSALTGAGSFFAGSWTISLIWPSSNALSCPSTVLLTR
jgi:hypothetical protein